MAKSIVCPLIKTVFKENLLYRKVVVTAVLFFYPFMEANSS